MKLSAYWQVYKRNYKFNTCLPLFFGEPLTLCAVLGKPSFLVDWDPVKRYTTLTLANKLYKI